MSEPIVVDGAGLTTAHVEAVARGAQATLGAEAAERMARNAAFYSALGEDRAVAAKWGWLVNRPASGDELPRRFVEGHCAGMGDPMPSEWVRAAMVARANALAVGCSGVRPAVVELLLAMLNAGVVPVVPLHGAVGAAGSVPLAHIARVALRLGGTAIRDGHTLEANVAMEGVPALEATQKEVLSLLNGSSFSTGTAALTVASADRILRAAEAAASLSFEVVQADLGSLSARAHAARGHRGSASVAQRMRERLAGSELVTPRRKADSFAIRCTPAVHGAASDALMSVRAVVEQELNGAIDNPLVFEDEGVVDAGNFHAAPVALALDHLKIALTMVAGIGERRVFRLTNAKLSGLPSFLLPDSGVNSGLMLAQYTAASLVSEAKQLSHPAAVDSIPTVQHHEDHVSMASVAATSALRIVELLADVVAVELLCGAQGLDFRLRGECVDGLGKPMRCAPKHPGSGSAEVHQTVRRHVERWVDDGVMYEDLARLGAAVRAGEFSV
jgi:histidine ammonia-lyase